MQRQFSLWVVRLRLEPNGYGIVPLACKRRPQMITERVRVTLERVRVSQSQGRGQVVIVIPVRPDLCINKVGGISSF